MNSEFSQPETDEKNNIVYYNYWYYYLLLYIIILDTNMKINERKV